MAQDSFRAKITGKGQAVILIPGLSSGGETWEATVGPALADNAERLRDLSGRMGSARAK